MRIQPYSGILVLSSLLACDDETIKNYVYVDASPSTRDASMATSTFNLPDAGFARDTFIDDSTLPDFSLSDNLVDSTAPHCQSGEVLEERCCGPFSLGLQQIVCRSVNGEYMPVEGACEISTTEFKISNDSSAHNFNPRLSADYITFTSNQLGVNHIFAVVIAELGDHTPIPISPSFLIPSDLNWGNDWRNDGCIDSNIWGDKILASCNWREEDLLFDDRFPGVVQAYDLFERRPTGFQFDGGNGDISIIYHLRRSSQISVSESTLVLGIECTPDSGLNIYGLNDQSIEQRFNTAERPNGCNAQTSSNFVVYESLRDSVNVAMGLPDIYLTTAPVVADHGRLDRTNLTFTLNHAERNPTVNSEGVVVFERDDNKLYISSIEMRNDFERGSREMPYELLTEGTNPSLSGNLLAFSKRFGNWPAIYIRDIETGKEARVRGQSLLQGRLVTSGRNIAYTLGNEERSDVYLLKINPADGCGF